MAHIDNIWIPIDQSKKETVTSAPTGTLLYQFDGQAVLLGVVPSSAGGHAPRALVKLDTFSARMLGGALDEDGAGAALTYEIEVDPRSAYDPAANDREAGDIVTNGVYLGMYASPPKGELVAVTLKPGISTNPPIAYRGWRMLVAGRPVFMRIDLD